MPGSPLAEADTEMLRLAALSEYGVLDAPPEDPLDQLTALAAKLFDVPVVLLSLVDADRQFFASRVGLAICELDRDTSFCTHAIRQPDIFLVPDAASDPRFAASPLVLGPPFIRFYAGKTLIAPGGERLGALCLIDTQPNRPFGAEDARNLRAIASLVMAQLEMRRIANARSGGRTRFEDIAATSPDAIICADHHGAITFANGAAERLFGHDRAALRERPLASLVAERWRAGFAAELDRLAAARTAELAGRTLELGGVARDGREFPAEFSLSPAQDGTWGGVGVIVRDITEHRRTEERLFRLASLDALTELPNRAGWCDAIARAFAGGAPFTVLLLDLDGFKRVNDTLGHLAGDLVIREVAGRLQEICAGGGLVARMGGDEFGVLLAGDDANHAASLAILLIRAISEPCHVGGEVAEIGLSIGIAFAPAHGRAADELFGAADLALYRAKAAGKGRFEVFSPALRDAAASRRRFELELRRAFADGAFAMFFQPQVTLPGARLAGAEALMRWNHRRRGLLAPAHFLDIMARDVGAGTIGTWALRTACQEAAAWRARVAGFRMGVNLFESQLRSDGFAAIVREALEESELPAEALELELAATLFAREDAALLRRLRILRDCGVGLVLDDAGTAPVSLSLFKRVPFSRIKIDRTLVRGIETDPAQAAIVGALVELGRRLGMAVSAKGVETEAQLAVLLACGCVHAQGHLWGGAMARAEFASAFLREPALQG